MGSCIGGGGGAEGQGQATKQERKGRDEAQGRTYCEAEHTRNGHRQNEQSEVIQAHRSDRHRASEKQLQPVAALAQRVNALVRH